MFAGQSHLIMWNDLSLFCTDLYYCCQLVSKSLTFDSFSHILGGILCEWSWYIIVIVRAAPHRAFCLHSNSLKRKNENERFDRQKYDNNPFIEYATVSSCYSFSLFLNAKINNTNNKFNCIKNFRVINWFRHIVCHHFSYVANRYLNLHTIKFLMRVMKMKISRIREK